MVGGMTYGAKKEVRLQLFEEALALHPGSAIGMVDYANALVMLEGDERMDRKPPRCMNAPQPASRWTRWKSCTWPWHGPSCTKAEQAPRPNYQRLPAADQLRRQTARGDFEQAVKIRLSTSSKGRVMLGAIFQPAPPVMMQAGSWPPLQQVLVHTPTAPAMA